MKIKKLIAVALTFSAVALAMPVMAADVYVIANSGLALAEDDVRDVFVGDKQIVGGTKVVPMDNAGLQKDFLDKVLKIDAPKYSNIWTKKGFRDGLNPPTVKSSDAEVISAVKSTPGAVGYVSSSPAGVKVIKKY
jgi:hypothetical protein